MMIKPRGTQKQFIDKSIEILTSKSTKKSIMVAPVAYGKSICIANTVIGLNAPTIILQPNQELLLQNYQKYTSYGYSATICCVSLKVKIKNKLKYTEIDGEFVRCDEVSNITYATIGSIKKYVDKIKELGVKYMIIDECHLKSGTSGVMRDFIRDTRIKNILGVTATPIVLRSSMSGAILRMMDRANDNLFSTLSHVVQIQEVISAKYWSPLKYLVRKVNQTSLVYNTNGSDYTEVSIKKMYDENNTENRAVDAAEYLIAQGRKSILIFIPSIAGAFSLQSKIPNSRVVTGKTKTEDRKKIITGFKNLEIQVVINVEVLTTGFDHPELDAIIMTRPTASCTLYYQIIGRATRIHPNKEDALIIDLAGNVARFGKVENLNYEYIDGYGWGLFNRDSLLTGYPIKAEKRPTKDTLREAATDAGFSKIKDHGNVIIWFGKHKGKALKHIPVGYLTFMVENFDFRGVKFVQFKNTLETYLKLI